jgi:hypothetical protein
MRRKNTSGRVLLVLIVLLIAVGVIVAHKSVSHDLKFKIAGSCVSALHGGVLYGTGSGFKPYEAYDIYVSLNGKSYDLYGNHNLAATGMTDALGHPSYWVWPCDVTYSDDSQVSPPGKYTVTLVMQKTGEKVSASFTIGQVP